MLVNRSWSCFGTANQLRDPLFCVGANYLEICDRAAASDATAAAVASGIRRLIQGGPEIQLDYPCHGPAGQRWFSLKARPIELDGRRLILVTHDDITDLKEAKLTQAENHARLQLALTAGRMGIWDADLRTGTESWSDTTYDVFGVDPGSFTPSYAAFMALVDPRDRDRFQAGMEMVLCADSNPEFANDCRIVLPDGRIRWIGGRGRLLRDAAGQPARLVGICCDITERKDRELELEAAYVRLTEQTALLEQRNRELAAANQAKGRFVANMSHEIRTPMNAVLGFADLLAHSSLDPAQARHVAIISDTSRWLLTIVNDILDLAKFEAGRLDLECIDFEPDEVVEQVRSLLTLQAAEHGLDLPVVLKTAANLVVRGDPTRLQQILVNLIGNGLKFTARGSVALTVHQLPAAEGSVRLRFEVQDTGIGIPHERQAELFQPFVQVDSSITRQHGGSGLGLAICHRLVEAMGGTIGLASETGKGSLFWFELPFAPGDTVVAMKRYSQAQADTRPLRILVVDDVAANRDLLAAMLGRHGHEVLLAENGAVAVELAASENLDVVLMDIQMPVMDGIAATQRIRLLPGPAATVPILALTASVLTNEHQRYLAVGMNHYLTKPMVWPDLFAILAEIAAGSRFGPSRPLAEAAIPMPISATAPLLDEAILDGMARTLPSPLFRRLLARGLDGAAQSHERLVGALGDPTQLAKEAHRLRGTAGSFGLARISTIAGIIEDRLQRHEPITDLLARLPDIITATSTAAAEYETGARPA
ncbi:MAG: ATP-binding protein [Geminicoccaceae bacterium]